MILIILIVVLALSIFYVLTLDFEPGTGFTEWRDRIREGKYRVIEKEPKQLEQKTQADKDN